MKQSHQIKAILVDLASNDELPLDMNELDPNVFNNVVKPTPSYSFFLFSKLYSLIVKIDDYAYDVLFDDILEWYNKYDESTYNDGNKPEYECMVEYLTAHQEDMRIQAGLSTLNC